MAVPPGTSPPAIVEAVEEIKRVYRSLPPRPAIEEVEAAVAVVRTATGVEEARLAESGRMEKPPGLPEDLFVVLQEVRRSSVLLHSHELMWQALHVLDLDRRFQVFDELIQRASTLLSPEDGGGEGGGRVLVVVVPGIDKNSVKGEDLEGEKKGVVTNASPLKSESYSGVETEKLSLLKVASLIETSAKDGTGVLELQGRLMDQVEWLPLSLGKLVDVTELNLSENRIMALPSTISSMTFLTKLDIHSNQLINLPDTFGELSNLIDLDLHGNWLKSLPASFGNLTNLHHLDLSSNRISLLPDALGKLTSLRRLNVEMNELEELPSTIGSCSSLVELRLDFNNLKALPEAIGKLEFLEVLTLRYNRVKELPTTMGSLSKLKELDVSFNELESIPETMCFAASLVKLNIGSNFADLRSLPRSIGNLEMLEELDISNNQIRMLPDSFRFLSKLKLFYADETPLKVPPRHVVKLGAQLAVQYMANLVSARDSSTRPAERKGCLFWLCLLFQPCSEDHDTGMDFVEG